MREVERTITTVINAALRPRCRAYLRGIGDLADEVLVMTSSGGLVPVEDAAELPAALLLSGPAGGVRAGAAAAAANGFRDAVTFDMGGTSTDVCLILDGAPAPAATRDVGGFTVRFPSLDVHTIGAGGGSIAGIDPGGALVVGPESAGADPGPACYGRGGVRPTVTDANLVAGHIPPAAAFGGLTLDRAAAAAALDAAGVTAGRRAGGRGRQHGAGPAGGVGRARRRPPWARARGLRRRRAPARLRAGRRAGHARRGRAGPGRRAVGGRPADRAAPP